MENFTAIFLASLGLGAVETIVVWNKGSAELVDPIMFVIVIGALLLQRRKNRESRVEDQAISSWQNAANVRPIPRELLRLPEVRWTMRALRVLFVAFLIAPPVHAEREGHEPRGGGRDLRHDRDLARTPHRVGG